ncbi:MAG: hypothetical protein AABY22_02400, partial [Nanoarchaeota archaeon]
MCVIIICTERRPDRNVLDKCQIRNPHGIGVVWFGKNTENKDVAKYKKGIPTVDELTKLLDTMELPYAIHFRNSSIGGENPLLNHPFEVTRDSLLRLEGECDKLLMHNGHISEYETYLSAAGIYLDNKELISDSRAIAMLVSNENRRFLNRLSNKNKFMLADASAVNEKGEIYQTFRYYGEYFDEKGFKG